MSVYKSKPGCVTLNLSTLEFDAVPTEGSTNLVESGAVAKFTDAVPEGTTPENPLVNESALAEFELAMLTNIPCAKNTLRFKFSKTDYDPTVAGVGSSGTWKKLNTKFYNVWDWTTSGTTFANVFEGAFYDSDNIVSVIAAGDTSTITSTRSMFDSCTSLTSVCLFDTSAVTSTRSMFFQCTSLTSVPLFDTSAVTSMYYMFNFCTSLTSVPLFDTSSVTDIRGMFYSCTSLTSVPLFDTSSVTDISNMFYNCCKVEGGALALYQQASTQETPPTTTSNCFKDCGKYTTTGAAELVQIPQSWGGTMPNP